MMKRVGFSGVAISVLLSACQSIAPTQANTAPPDAQAAATPIQNTHPSHPSVSEQIIEEEAVNEVEMLQEHVKLLEQNIAQLQEQVQRLTRQQVGMNQSIGVLAKSQGVRTQNTLIDTSVLKADPTYGRAYQQFQQKKYTQAIQTLRPYANGGDGGNEASSGMYLLMLSHKNLKQCESTIAVGRQFQQRFPQHIRAAEALYSVGQCQYDMQQKDIARETWKRVRVLYPHSAAAKRAAQQLK